MSLNLLKITNWLLLMTTILPLGLSRLHSGDWDQCVPKCHCIHVNGRKQANCAKAEMNEIPTGLSTEIQILAFNDNNVRKLESQIFSTVGLVNLYKIFLKNCSIEEVDKHAFAHLALINHIDLSDNKIKRLDPVTFQQVTRLHCLQINNNLIKRLENNLFSNLPQLQVVEFNSNQLSEIGDRAFVNLTKLMRLKFKDNEFVQLQSSIFQLVGSQFQLDFDLRNNPWHCDCQLRQFFDFAKNNSFSSSTFCSEPENMRNQSWDLLNKEQFICLPDETKVETGDEKVTVRCQLVADPNSKLDWRFDVNSSNGAFCINITDGKIGNKCLLESKMVEDQENTSATILKQINDKTLDEKLAIIINQNELLRRKVEQLEVKIDHFKNFTPRKNMDAEPAQNEWKNPIGRV